MILTCPDCATRYFVDEAKLGPQGRKVRCAGCGHAWRAEAEGEPLELAPVAEFAAPDEAVAAVRPGEALSKSFRAQAEARRRTRQAMAAGAVWAGLAAGFVVIMLAAVVFRVQVVRLWPRTAGAYAALRLPVNPLGLSPEGVQALPGLEDGRAMLFVRGMERNVEAAPRMPAPLRVSLYDKAGARLSTQVVEVGGEALKPGEARPFAAAFVDPPLSGAQVGVDFVFRSVPSTSVPPRPAKVATATPALRLRRGGPALPAPTRPAALPIAKLAEPLPADSPYALPVAAQAQAGGARPDG